MKEKKNAEEQLHPNQQPMITDVPSSSMRILADIMKVEEIKTNDRLYELSAMSLVKQVQGVPYNKYQPDSGQKYVALPLSRF